MGAQQDTLSTRRLRPQTHHARFFRHALLAIAVSIAVDADAQAQEAAPAVAETSAPSNEFLGRPLAGSISVRLRSRWSGDDDDQDLFKTLMLNWGDELEDPVTFHCLARMSQDLDRDRGENEFNAFDGIQDAFKSPVTGNLYYAYADIHRLGMLQRGRVGRQFVDETPTSLHFDGIRLNSEPFESVKALQVGAYAGIPVHPYEFSSDGDSIAGTYAQASLWKGNRTRLDHTRVVDETDENTFRNDLYGVGMWQSVGNALQLDYRRTFLDRSVRDQRGRVIFSKPDLDLQVELSVYQLLQAEETLATDFDSFTTVMQEYAPYQKVGIHLSKGYGEHFALDVGVDVRELENEDSDEGTFNREYRRYFATPSVHGLGWEGLAASLTVEQWNVLESDDGDFWTIGADVTHRCTDRLKVSVGTAYALTQYDFLMEEVRQEVRTVYARTGWKVAKQAKFDAGWEYENSDYEDDNLNHFHTFKIGVTYFLGKP